MCQSRNITAAILIIGDEILSGRTTDRNTPYLARQLDNIGIALREVRIVADIESGIVRAVNRLRIEHDYLFTTGGIGPTHDDITADAIAKAFDVPIDIDERAVDMMRLRFDEDELQGDRLRMARIPAGARLIANSISASPGFMIGNVIVMAGIPEIMQVMFDAVLPSLPRGKPVYSKTLRVITPESDIAAILREVQNRFDNLCLGSYPFFEKGVLGTHLVLRSSDKASLEAALKMLFDRLHAKGLDIDPG